MKLSRERDGEREREREREREGVPKLDFLSISQSRHASCHCLLRESASEKSERRERRERVSGRERGERERGNTMTGGGAIRITFLLQIQN